MEPLQVLIAADTYPPQLNGAAVASQRLARGLADRGHSVAVVAPNMAFQDETQTERSDGNAVQIFRIKSISIRPVHPQFRLTWGVGVDAKLERIFEGFRPDIVHLQNHFILGNACLRQARKWGIPAIGTNHFMPDNLYEFIPVPLRPTISAIMWRHYLRTYNNLDWVLSPSHACQQLLADVGLTARMRVISNGIDLSKYRRLDPPDDIYSKYGIRPGVPMFLSVGRLEKDKNVDLIIKASAIARKKTEFQTVIVGTGKDEAEFRGLARKLGLEGTVILTGFVPDEDLTYLYNVADVYIGAGLAELQGIAVMEAMATGLPVLAADAVALPELVEDGVNGFLFGPDREDLAARMLQMLAHPGDWPRMGEKSLVRIQPHDTTRVLGQVE
ncbi:MAG TPA: glycosyltransferase, partial [Dehalococcoidia bacterium]|nr:glycosyltransferase [Dehalococcoidia bacterium]